MNCRLCVEVAALSRTKPRPSLYFFGPIDKKFSPTSVQNRPFFGLILVVEAKGKLPQSPIDSSFLAARGKSKSDEQASFQPFPTLVFSLPLLLRCDEKGTTDRIQETWPPTSALGRVEQ